MKVVHPNKSVADRLKTVKAQPQRTEPLWKGPEVDGITYSMLSRFLVCRERFRVAYVVGLKPADTFTPVLEFGQMWHVCEESFAKMGNNTKNHADVEVGASWEYALIDYCKGLCGKYPLQQEQVNHWYEMCKAMFPLYVEHWSQHPDVLDRTPLLQEQVFDVPYKLPSGRTVRLRGKWDSVDMIGEGKATGVYLQENKTKSGIDVGKLTRQLGFDLQTMIYLIAMEEVKRRDDDRYGLLGESVTGPIKGVRYNVVRRSAHKSVGSMLKKLEEDRAEGRIGEWFSRWQVEVSPQDVAKFRRECLDPVLEQLCDWYDHIQSCQGAGISNFYGKDHWRHPFGVWNVLDEGGSSDLDNYLDTGSRIGLQVRETLFEELR